jgi:hypothetical protein
MALTLKGSTPPAQVGKVRCIYIYIYTMDFGERHVQ